MSYPTPHFYTCFLRITFTPSSHLILGVPLLLFYSIEAKFINTLRKTYNKIRIDKPTKIIFLVSIQGRDFSYVMKELQATRSRFSFLAIK